MIKHLKNLSAKALMYVALYVVVKWAIILGAGTWLYKNGLWKNEYLLVLPVIAIIVMGIRFKKGKMHDNQSQTSQSMPTNGDLK